MTDPKTALFVQYFANDQLSDLYIAAWNSQSLRHDGSVAHMGKPVCVCVCVHAPTHWLIHQSSHIAP